ncbi:MAG TPA: hypothetical protein VFS00_18820, partial [Polyangiaceae bacterium]|nr:hypothetical protein [Polyangiaceae bacterium]
PPGAALAVCESVFVYDDPVARAFAELHRPPPGGGVLPPYGVELAALAGPSSSPGSLAKGPYRGAANG